MGAAVSHEHAKLPFAYTYARNEDHACTASTSTPSSLTSSRQRLAHRLLLIRNADSTSVTPLSTHRPRLMDERVDLGSIPPYTALGIAPSTAAPSLISHLSMDDTDSDNDEILSLCSILNQGPELEL
ncbi:hypothetical protein BGZ54_005215 [Gamsiella multidivaricata]|nr:hypothetical protein BGZ54_005215 [Gamsiella multidivaricata]